MYSYKASDVNEALSIGLQHLLREGQPEDSRAGKVLVAPAPVCIEYTDPRQRVLLSPTRDANCVFHFMEAIWMLSGSNEIEFPCFFNKSYSQFSDDGGRTMWDSYGWRWRTFFGYDQLDAIVEELRKNPTSRRCVLAMWNSSAHHVETGRESLAWTVGGYKGEEFFHDLDVATNGGKAVPCNTHCYFAVKNGKLNLTVCNRSNDIIWGAIGANAVTFSFLLEYMAMRVGVPMGTYFQFTNNLHCYTDRFDIEKLNVIEDECDTVGVLPESGPAIEEGFDEDLALFMPWALQVIRTAAPPFCWNPDGPVPESTKLALDVPACKTAFFHGVTIPMFLFWVYRKWKDEYSSNVCLAGIDAPDWQRACREWAERRKK